MRDLTLQGTPAGLILSLDEALPLDEALAHDEAAAPAARIGPKAATLAQLRRAGLPVPDGFCLAADAYRAHLSAAGLDRAAEQVAGADEPAASRLALAIRAGLARVPLDPSVAAALDAACRRLSPASEPLVAVRSSALGEGTPDASFAGQLETLLGVAGPVELAAAVRACWGSLWSPRAVRYMRARGADPARTAVAVLVQRQVPARSAGGALSRTAGGQLELTAAWGLGPAVAQGVVVPDRYLLRRDARGERGGPAVGGPVLEQVEPGRKGRLAVCSPEGGLRWEAVAPELVAAPCLPEADAVALARLVLRAEAVLGSPVEVEWALDDEGFHLLQARPLAPPPRRAAGRPRPAGEPARGPALTGQPPGAPAQGPVLVGHPAAPGLAAGPARVVRGEAELVRVAAGDVLVTRVPGPALAAVLPRAVGVVAELGGSTSHLAALARERGIPAVLGVRDATRRIPDGAPVVVDGSAGEVHLPSGRGGGPGGRAGGPSGLSGEAPGDQRPG